MKSKLLLAGSFLLLAAFLLSGCVGTAPTAGTSTAPAATTAAPAGEPEYAVLNPRSDLPPVEAKALAPRLDTLEGKTVFVTATEGSAVLAGKGLMIEIARALAQTVPGVKVIYEHQTKRVEPAEPGLFTIGTVKDAEKNADAVISGNGF